MKVCCRVILELVFLLLMGFAQGQRLDAASTAGIFGGGPFYSGGATVMNDLRASGFTTVILWTIHVDASTGDLIFNDQKVVSNGVYVGNAVWPGQLVTLKQTPTSVNRIEVGIGSWGVNDFQSIKTLMAAQGTNTTSILYRNFRALKTATGADALNLDDEMLYDVTSTVKFCLMCASMGYKVSLCPYMTPNFWSGCMTQINTQRPGTVDAVFLQCYAGGAGNDPSAWNSTFGGFKVYPGLWCRHGGSCSEGDSPSSITSRMAAWKKSAGINGGFLWLYDDMRSCTSEGTTVDYARAINSAFRLPAPTGLAGIPGGGAVLLAWNPLSGATSYNIKRSSYATGPFTTIATNVTNPWLLLTNLSAGMRLFYAVSGVNASGEGLDSAPVSAVPCSGTLPTGWSAQDIGNAGMAGEASYCSSTFTLQAGGSGIGNQTDEFHFASVPAAGDAALIARVSFFEAQDVGARAGVMFRNDSGSSSAFVSVVVTAGQGIVMEARSTAGGASVLTSGAGGSVPAWLQLVRKGNTFTGYCGSDGVHWTELGTAEVVMAGTALSGLAATANSSTNTALAIVDHVSNGAPVNLGSGNSIVVTRLEGASCTFAAMVSGALPMDYYWNQDGTNLAGANESALTLTNLSAANAGYYSIVASNALGCITNGIGWLTVVSASNSLYPRTIVASHPLGMWRLNEPAGKTAFDCIGGNDGTFTNVLCGQPGYTPYDKSARFGYFSRSNCCVTISAVDFAASANAAFTVEAWVNGIAQTNDSGILTKGTGAGGEQFNLDCGSANHGFRFFVRDASGGAHLANASVVPNGKWHHLAGVCDQARGRVILYVDGTNAAQGTITAGTGLLATASPMTVGARQSGAGTPFDLQFMGYVADVAIYDYTLNAAQIQMHYNMATNRPPVFSGNPLFASDATAGKAYSGTLAGSASDPNGGTLTFSKTSGPDWLSVSVDGAIFGTPLSGDAGTNQFGVNVTDPTGLIGSTMLSLNVIGPAPIIITMTMQGTNLMLAWNGGIGPYQVETATNLGNPSWQDAVTNLTENSMLIAPSNAAAFYRVRGR